MRPWLLYCSIATALAVGVPQRAVGQVLYDNFNAANRLIDINKWAGFETEWRGTEANRRIDAGKLRITARGAGLLAATPTGTIFSDFGLYHPNPNPVTLWQATVEIVDFDALACPVANSTPNEAWATLRGNFFNSGTPIPGSFINEVFALISLVRRSNAAAVDTVVVEAAMFRCTDASCSPPTRANIQRFPMGTLTCLGRICPPVTLRITWEEAANRFRFLRGAVGALPALEQIANYTLSDANRGRPSRTLSVAPVPATCTAAAGRRTAFMDVLFDNVLANVVNVGTNSAGGFDAVDLGETLGPGEIPVP
jgi:hypothetical protein